MRAAMAYRYPSAREAFRTACLGVTDALVSVRRWCAHGSEAEQRSLDVAAMPQGCWACMTEMVPLRKFRGSSRTMPTFWSGGGMRQTRGCSPHRCRPCQKAAASEDRAGCPRSGWVRPRTRTAAMHSPARGINQSATVVYSSQIGSDNNNWK